MVENSAPGRERSGSKAIAAIRMITFTLFTVSSVMTLVLASYASFSLAYPTYDSAVLLPDDFQYETETGHHWADRDKQQSKEASDHQQDKKQLSSPTHGIHTLVRNSKNPLLSNVVFFISLTSLSVLIFASGLVKYGSPIIGGALLVLAVVFFVILSAMSPALSAHDEHIYIWSLFLSVFYFVVSVLFFALAPLNRAISRLIRALIAGVDERFPELTTGDLNLEETARVPAQPRRRRPAIKIFAKFLWNSLQPRQQQSLVLFAFFFVLSFIAFACTLLISPYTAAVVLIVLLVLGLVASGLLSSVSFKAKTKGAEAQGTIAGAKTVRESKPQSNLDGTS